MKIKWVPSKRLVTQQVGQQIRRPARMCELVGQPRLSTSCQLANNVEFGL